MPLDSSAQKLTDFESHTQPLQSPQLSTELQTSYDYFWNQGHGHFFYREGAGSVHVRSFVEVRNKSLLVVFPGRGESSLKYAELAWELRGLGMDIVIIDHRGQGLSERSYNTSEYTHVDRFDDYVQDAQTIIKHFKEQKKYKRTCFFGHSMGGAIALRLEQLEGESADGVILSAPMLKIRRKKVPLFMANLLVQLNTFIGRERKPVWARSITDNKKEYTQNQVTHCEHRFSWARELEKRHPQSLSGAPTMSWLREALAAGRLIMRGRKSFKKPILLMQAEDDTIVCNKAQNLFAHEVQNCRIIRLKGAFHEIVQEDNSIRNRALVQMTKFLKTIGEKK